MPSASIQGTSRAAISVILPRGRITEIAALDVPCIEADGIAERSFSPAAVRTLSENLKREKQICFLQKLNLS